MDRKLTAILYADVAGYSRLTGADEEGTHATLKTHLGALTETITGHGGRICHFAGDAVLAEFGSVVTALKCAVSAQRDLADRNRDHPDERRLQFRIGVNLGDVIVDGDEIYGNGVNVAARLESLADEGGICISGHVLEEVEDKLDVGFASLGPQSVKNIKKPVDAYRVLLDLQDAGRFVDLKEQPPPRWGRIAAVGLVVFLAATIGVALWHENEFAQNRRLETMNKTEHPDERPSIAVLPFDNFSGDPEEEYFTDGFTEDLITALAQDPHLLVIARHSSFIYKNQSSTPQEIAKHLGVQYIVEGSIRRSNEMIRITAQLINAESGTHVWAEKYDRDFADLFAVQDEIIEKIVLSIGGTYGQIWREKAFRVNQYQNENLSAIEHFWRFKPFYYQFSKDGIRRAKNGWQAGMEKYPNFALFHPAVGWMHYWEGRQGWSDNAEQSLVLAEELGRNTLAMENASPLALYYAHWLLAKLHGIKDKRLDLSLSEYDKAHTLMPNSADLLASKAEILSYAEQPEEAIRITKEAIRLNPHHPDWYPQYLGLAYYVNGQYGEALDVLKGINRDWLKLRSVLAACYVRLGMIEEARREVAELRRIDPEFSLRKLPTLLPFQDQGRLEKHLAELRNAGLPEG
jgi:TolB-like protein/class 3 adenylate cyclase